MKCYLEISNIQVFKICYQLLIPLLYRQSSGQNYGIPERNGYKTRTPIFMKIVKNKGILYWCIKFQLNILVNYISSELKIVYEDTHTFIWTLAKNHISRRFRQS